MEDLASDNFCVFFYLLIILINKNTSAQFMSCVTHCESGDELLDNFNWKINVMDVVAPIKTKTTLGGQKTPWRITLTVKALKKKNAAKQSARGEKLNFKFIMISTNKAFVILILRYPKLDGSAFMKFINESINSTHTLFAFGDKLTNTIDR